jgi:hypothetical protein
MGRTTVAVDRRAAVELLDENGGSPGVRLRKRQLKQE